MVLFGDFQHALFYGDRRNGVKIEQSPRTATSFRPDSASCIGAL